MIINFKIIDYIYNARSLTSSKFLLFVYKLLCLSPESFFCKVEGLRRGWEGREGGI